MLGMVQERRCHKLDTDTGLPAKECQSGDWQWWSLISMEHSGHEFNVERRNSAVLVHSSNKNNTVAKVAGDIWLVGV